MGTSTDTSSRVRTMPRGTSSIHGSTRGNGGSRCRATPGPGSSLWTACGCTVDRSSPCSSVVLRVPVDRLDIDSADPRERAVAHGGAREVAGVTTPRLGLPRMHKESRGAARLPPRPGPPPSPTSEASRRRAGHRLRHGLPRRGLPACVPDGSASDRTRTPSPRTWSWCSGRPRIGCEQLRRGATLVSMLHFPTRPGRVARLVELGLDAICLDLLADDVGHRLVVDGRGSRGTGSRPRSTCWSADGRSSPRADTAAHPGDRDRRAARSASTRSRRPRSTGTSSARIACAHLPGVEVMTIGRNLTGRRDYMGSDWPSPTCWSTRPSGTIRACRWSRTSGSVLPEHAVICDLVVDPYLLHERPPTVRGIEGIPQGNLDQ